MHDWYGLRCGRGRGKESREFVLPLHGYGMGGQDGQTLACTVESGHVPVCVRFRFRFR